MESMPPIGLGTAHLITAHSIQRSITPTRPVVLDCAKVYGNEELLGREVVNKIKNGNLRNQVFVVTKLWNDDHGRVEQACRESLARLQLDCLDLYLIHWPMAWKKGTVFSLDSAQTLEQTWRDMERLVDLKLTKHIGVSNFDKSHLDRILKCCRIKPCANQLEIHPLLSQMELVLYNQSKGLKVMAWSPLAKYGDVLIKSKALQALAERKTKTVAQIVLRWHIQRGICPIPRSSNAEHAASNLDVFDFELSDSEMQIISQMNQNKRLTRDWIGIFDSTDWFPFKFPISYLIFGFFKMIFWIFPHKVDLMGNPFAR